MVAVRIEIVRYVDAGFPGFVELHLVDARGRLWSFVEKVPVVTNEALDANSEYPRSATIACEIVRRDAGTARVSTLRPWGVESVDGESEFDVDEGLLVDE